MSKISRVPFLKSDIICFYSANLDPNTYLFIYLLGYLPPYCSPPYADTEQAMNVRAMRRSVMQYSSFDWSNVPRAQERRTSAEKFRNPQIITTEFR